jgi:hypothetical protein
MFDERKRDMITTKVGGEAIFNKPGDENSQFYNRPDEPPISHPAEVLERLKREKPDASMEDLVKEADTIVAGEIEQRRKQREANMAIPEGDENSTETQVSENPANVGEEVTST